MEELKQGGYDSKRAISSLDYFVISKMVFEIKWI